MNALNLTLVTIESYLTRLPKEHEILLTLEQTFRVADVEEKISQLRSAIPQAKGASVVLRGLSPIELILAIASFDGYAASLLLIPGSIEPDDATKLIIRVGPNVEILPRFNVKKPNDETPNDSDFEVTRWLLSTSGTTGEPKVIEHTFATLSQKLVTRSEKSSSFVWGLLYDPNRFAGLQVVLQALLSGSRLIVPDSNNFDIQISTIINFKANAISATPTLWRKLLMDGRIAQLQLKQITLGGEIADQSILDALRVKFSNSRIVHIYASTESGTGFSVKDGLEGFPLEWIDNSQISPLLLIGGDGHLYIKPKVLPGGTEIESRLTTDGYLDTQDKVAINKDRVVFLGRASGAINVGGNKLNPEWLEGYLMQIEGIEEAYVYGITSKIVGQLVATSIVPAAHNDLKNLRLLILEKCKRDLEKWQIPAIINFVNELPLTAAGKLKRN